LHHNNVCLDTPLYRRLWHKNYATSDYKTEECFEGPQIPLLTFRDMKSITEEGFIIVVNGGNTHQVYCFARRLL